MKISVVIPAYNEELFLPHLLTSLRNQTFPLPYEIIVVDNNSTDNTAQIAKSFGARVIPEKKRGYAYACNAGFEAAKGDIIARADADYVQPKEWLEKIWKAFEQNPDIIALGGPLYPLESHFWENFFYYPGIVLWMYFLKILGRGFLFPNMAVRRSAYKKSGGFDTNIEFGEDTEMCLALKRVGKVAFMPNIYIYTSIRRMRSLGFIQTVFGYSFGNQIAMWMGKKATVGLEPIRVIPTTKPHQYNPFLFLFTLPVLLFVLFFSIFFILPNNPGQQIVENTNRVTVLSDKAIQKRLQVIKNAFPWNAIFSPAPVKEI